jgi:pimeloyl-ACP methyl ester carboxylesterase
MQCIVIFFVFTTLLISGCHDSQSAGSNATSPTNKEMKPDSTSGYANVNSLKMYYEIQGKGNPLVLIHGGGSTIQTSFGRIIPELSLHRQIIAVELQGHGHTGDINIPESFQQDADDVAALLKHLKIDKADFFGFSNGGNTTMQIALRHPELINKIILGSTFFKRDGMIAGFWDFMKDATFEQMPQPLKDAYMKVAPNTNDLIHMFEKDKNRMVEFTDWKAEDIHTIKAPALIISGDADVVRPEHAVEMFRLLPHAQLVILPGAHGEYMGEIATKQDPAFIASTIVLIDKFLDEPMPK